MTIEEEIRALHETAAAARLLDKGCNPRGTPQGDPEYLELLRRYRGDAGMQDAAQRIADGRRLRILHADPLFGCILAASEGCEWAMPLSRIEGYQSVSHRIRTAIAVVVPFVGSLFYPTAAQLEDPRFSPVPRSEKEIFAALRGTCETLRVAKAGGEDAFERGDNVTVLRGDQAAKSAWLTLIDLPEGADHETKQRVRRMETLRDVVHKMLDYMVKWGLLKDDGDGIYPTRKFQVLMAATVVPGFYGRARTALNGGA